MCAVAAAIPLPSVLTDALETYRLLMGGVPLADALAYPCVSESIFDGMIGLYSGVIIRKVEWVDTLPEGARILVRHIPVAGVFDGGA